MIRKSTNCLLFAVIITSCADSQKQTESEAQTEIENPTNQAIRSSEIQWEKLNPARGDKSPQAATIWGDRNDTVPTGFLAKFIDGFSSPPHIHNVTYRAVVIKGLIHNDDSTAENMWMTPASFWTQPAGQQHITSAKGEENIAYVEIDRGPYLVQPIGESFDNGERPINVDASNVLWLGEDKTNWIDSGTEAEISFLWETESENGRKGLFVKLPQSFQGSIESSGTEFHAIVVSGALQYEMPKSTETKSLDAGSYFTSTDRAIHQLSNLTEEEVILYMRTNGAIRITEGH